MKKFKKDLVDFINKSTSCYTCIEVIKKELNSNGYKELYEEEEWNLDSNKYYIVRNDASIIAFSLSKENSNSFHIITSHSDTPSLTLKPSGAYISDNYLKYNIMPYGGLLNYGWLDHPLSLSGRVIIKENDKLISKIVDMKKPLLIVPSVAIHQKNDSNTNLDLNVQKDLQPLLGLSNDKNTWLEILSKEIEYNTISEITGKAIEEIKEIEKSIKKSTK